MKPVFWLHNLSTWNPSGLRWLFHLAIIAVGALPLLSQSSTNSLPALVTRVGGTLSAMGIAVSPDGKWFASEAQDGAITIWSTEDGSEYRAFPAFTAYSQLASPGHLAVASDAATIAVLAGADVHLIDVKSARELRSFPASSIQWDTWQIAANPKSMTAAVITQSGNVSVLSLEDGHPLFHTSFAPLNHPSGLILLHVAFSPDGRLLAIVTDNAFQLWDWAANRKLLDIDAHAFYRSNLSRTVTAQDGNTTKQSTAEEQHYFRFTGASFSADGKHLGLTSYDELNILDLPSGSRVSSIKTAPSLFPGCIFATDDLVFLPQLDLGTGIFSLAKGMLGTASNVNLQDYVSVPGQDRGIMLSGVPYLVKASTFSVLNAMFAKARPPQSLAFTPDGKQLLAGTFFKLFASWNLDSGEALAFPGAGDVTSPAISTNGHYLASADLEGLRVFSLSGKLNESHLPVKIHSFSTSLSFSSSGNVLGLSQQSGQVDLFSLPQKTTIASFSADHPTGIAIQPDGSRFALADRAGTTIYSVTSSPAKTVTLPIDDPNHIFKNTPPYFVQFSPDGKWLAVMETTELRLISTQTWSEVRKIEGAGGLCATFSPDSRLIAAPMQSAGVEIVDVSSGTVLFQDKEHSTSCPISFSADGAIFAAASPYGTKMYSTSDGHLLATLYLFSDETQLDKQLLDWLVVTPDGLFDGTPGAWNQLGWRFSGDTFDVAPVEIFFQNFYHPGLLAEIATGRVSKAPSDIASIDRRQPSVSVTAPGDPSAPRTSRAAQLELSVVQAQPDKTHPSGSGVRDLRLFRNGTLVKAWRGDIKLDGAGRAQIAAEIPVVAGENRFTAYAFNNAGIKSPDAKLTIAGADSLQRRGTAWVISLGIDHYAAGSAENRLNLNFAESDAADFATQFTHDQQQLDQFAQVRRVDLLGKDATKANLEAALHLLSGASPDSLDEGQRQLLSGVAAVQPEDGVFIFYAGHGVAFDNHFYLIPQDFNPDVPLGDPRSRTVSDVELSQLLERISPARSFLIIDACNSGQVVDPKTPVGPTDAAGLAQLAYEKGLYILAASKNSEPALETHALGNGHGFLTYALVDEGLKAGDAARNGVIELRPWFLYATRRVPEMQADQLGRRTLLPEGSGPGLEARQHPRIFYRREPELQPFIVGKFTDAVSSKQ